ncbi:MAG: hypothetical protein IJH12_03310 [Clostridia bacterium]|nr:hypothetical protein [Clostridia bacterium]
MKKKLFIVALIIIIIAAFIVAAVGYNVDIKYRNHVSVIVPIGEEYNMNDIKKITDEVFGNSDIVLEKSGLYNDEVSIRVADASDEQLETLKNKINEKYNIVQSINVNIGEDYNIEDAQNAVKEALGKDDIKVEKESENESYISIEASLLTEKDIENINDKINEKFGLSNKADSIRATNVISSSNIPRVRLMDMASQYILFTLIATVVVLAYYIIRYRKLGIKDVLQDSITVLAFAELLYMAIIAITRFPVNKLIVMGAFTIYFAVIIYLNAKYIGKLEKIKNK